MADTVRGLHPGSNGSRIGKRDLANVMDFVTLNHAEIRSRWKDYFHGDISFHE